MKNYFFGRYFKCCSNSGTVAFIPAYHKRGKNASASLQVITEDGTWCAVFPIEAYITEKDGFGVRIGDNRFEKTGISLSYQNDELTLKGEISFGAFCSIKGDIMGPFRFLPFMQCRHSVYSMRHTLNGRIEINGKEFIFENSDGYIEGDRGRSFPKEYAWTHCFSKDASIMLSCAHIPVGLFHFTGIIGAIVHRGKKYRLATYNGAGLLKCENGELIVKKKDLLLKVRLLDKPAHPLLAPQSGQMVRTIRESASCKAEYILEKGGKTLFSFISDEASFEYEYPI